MTKTGTQDSVGLVERFIDNDFWKKQLAGAEPFINLPLDKPRPPVFTFRGATVARRIPARLVEALRALGQRQEATLFMTVLATLNMLLCRYSGQEEILIGLANGRRDRAELDGMVNCFADVLPLRMDLSGNPTFQELLRRAREMTLNALAHQDVPFVKLVEALELPRDRSQSFPLVQVALRYEDAEMPSLRLPDVEVEPLPQHHKTATFDVHFDIEERADGLLVVAEYNVDLFEAATVERMLASWEHLLDQVATGADPRLYEVSMLTAAERRRMLVGWNATARAHTPYCIHHRFETQLELRRDTAAVTFGGRELTYGELNRQANQLAHRLQRLGVGPDVLVGLCMERGFELIVAMLGILKAGGAYVPLDPSHPRERLAFMLADTKVPVLLTQAELLASLPKERPPVLCLDADGPALSQESEHNPESRVLPEHLAYVIYTSGSTGKPKGVLIEHRAASNFMDFITETFAMGPQDRVLQFASPGFDVSVFEIFSTLLTGGRLVMGSRAELLSPPDLTRLMQEQGVTVIDMPPAVMALLQAEAFPALRIAFVGGEAFPGELVNRWASPGRRFINGYGPTEATVTMTLMECQGRTWTQTPPIGQPMPNHRCYVLDPYRNPVPVGVAGELYLAGAGLARGYLNRPELTAEKFVMHDFGPGSAAPGAAEGPALEAPLRERLYRTGDLVRYLADGNLEFLGRIDRQVKIRGLRIELGEIEAVLSQHAAVKQVSVVVREDTPGQKSLVAYVVASPAPEPRELREFLRQRLPSYMVPWAFVLMESLPLTASGKLDWRTLPAPETPAGRGGGGDTAPRTPVEQAIAELWRQVLSVEQVGPHDNFFELGGSSLQAMLLVTRIRHAFDVALSPQVLFEAPTVEDLAARIAAPATESWSPLVSIRPTGQRSKFFCVHPGGGSVFCYSDLVRLLHPDQPFFGLQAAGLEGEQEPSRSIAAMARRYIEAIRHVEPQGPYRLGGWSAGGTVAFEMARQLEAQGVEVDLVALLDSHLIDDSTDTPPIRLFIQDLASIAGKETPALGEDFDRLSLEEQLARGLGALRAGGGLPEHLGPQPLRHRFHVFQGIVQALGEYTAGGPVNSRLLLFQAQQSPDAVPGWRGLSRSVEVQLIPGNHYTILQPPNVHALASALQEALDRA